MPFTPVYGFHFEDADDQPGVSLTGGSVGTELILAEQVENEIQRVEGDIGNVEDRVTAVEARLDLLEAGTTQPGWTPIASGSAGSTASFIIDLTNGGRFLDGAFEMYRLQMRYDLDGGSGNVLMRVNSDDSAIYRSGLVNYPSTGPATSDIALHFSAAQGWRVARGATLTSNNMELLLFAVTGGGVLTFQSTSNRQSDTASVHQWIECWGALSSGTLTPTSLRLHVFGGDLGGDSASSFTNAWWYVEGFRPSV